MKQFELTSAAFPFGGDIPDLYTCRGKNISPPLRFNNPPAGTRSYALVAEDLDTPVGRITHWVLYNIPPEIRDLAEGVPAGQLPVNGLRQGRNGGFRCAYMGPCPPWGRHRYLFRLFALNITLEFAGVLNKRKLLRLIEAHVLAHTTLLGYYAR